MTRSLDEKYEQEYKPVTSARRTILKQIYAQGTKLEAEEDSDDDMCTQEGNFIINTNYDLFM